MKDTTVIDMMSLLDDSDKVSMDIQLMRDFETFLEQNNEPSEPVKEHRPYYLHLKDKVLEKHLKDARTALSNGNTAHARKCIEWAREYKNGNYSEVA